MLPFEMITIACQYATHPEKHVRSHTQTLQDSSMVSQTTAVSASTFDTSVTQQGSSYSIHPSNSHPEKQTINRNHDKVGHHEEEIPESAKSEQKGMHGLTTIA